MGAWQESSKEKIEESGGVLTLKESKKLWNWKKEIFIFVKHIALTENKVVVGRSCSGFPLDLSWWFYSTSYIPKLFFSLLKLLMCSMYFALISLRPSSGSVKTKTKFTNFRTF